METLPYEVLSKIQSYILRGDQPSFRRTSLSMANTNVDWNTICCDIPTKNEIIEWLFEQNLYFISQLGYRLNSSSNVTMFDETYVRFTFIDVNNNQKDVHVFLTKSGKIRYESYDENMTYTGEFITSKTQLIQLLNGRILYIDFVLDPYITKIWFIIKSIISKRFLCIGRNIQVNECMLNILKKYMYLNSDIVQTYYGAIQTYWKKIVLNLDDVINDTGKQKIIRYIISLVPGLLHVSSTEKLSLFFNRVPGLPKFIPYFDYEDENPKYLESPTNYSSFLNYVLYSSYLQLIPTDLN